MRTPLLMLLALSACATAPRSSDATTSPTPEPSPAVAESAPPQSISDIAEAAVQSVVSVNVTAQRTAAPPPGWLPHPFGLPMPPSTLPQRRSQGSGVVVDATRGLLLTNHHVVDGAERVEVALPSGESREAEVVGSDPKSDLAVLRLVNPPRDLVALPLGDSEALRLGETVLAIGSPFGVGQTVTMGIVSAKGRANVGIVDYEDFIQTDAAINPGNSGGALVNLKGELVGINTAILSRSGGYQGIGFAIPRTLFEPVFNSLLTDGAVRRGFLGIQMQPIDAPLAEALGRSNQQGVLVSDVVPDSPAERSGLRRGDVIVAIDGEPIPGPAQLRNAIAGRSPSSEVRLTVDREGRERDLRCKLAQLQDDTALQGGAQIPGSAPATEHAGLVLRSLSDSDRVRLSLDDATSGLLVQSVTPGSRADEAGIRPNDVVEEVDHRRVRRVSDVDDAFEGGEAVLVAVVRQGSRRYLALPPAN